MKLTTIWSIPSMTLMERLRRSVDWAAFESAARLPSRIKYWATIQNIAKATSSSPHIPAEPVGNILDKIPGGPR